jgi:hypothetical protein
LVRESYCFPFGEHLHMNVDRLDMSSLRLGIRGGSLRVRRLVP